MFTVLTLRVFARFLMITSFSFHLFVVVVVVVVVVSRGKKDRQRTVKGEKVSE